MHLLFHYILGIETFYYLFKAGNRTLCKLDRFWIVQIDLFLFFVLLLSPTFAAHNNSFEVKLLKNSCSCRNRNNYSFLFWSIKATFMAPLPFINYSNATKVSLLGISLTEDEDEFVFRGEKHQREWKQTH